MSTPSSRTGRRIRSLLLVVVVVGGVAVTGPATSAQQTDTPEPDTVTAESTTTGVTTNGISGLLVGVAAVAVLWYRRWHRGE